MEREPRTRIVHVRLTESEYARLADIADRGGASVSQVVRFAVSKVALSSSDGGAFSRFLGRLR